MYKAVFGTTNHPDIASTYMNMGTAYHGLGEYTSALEYYNKSLEMFKAIFGTTNHPDIAKVTHNILIASQYQNKSTNSDCCLMM